MLASVTSQTLDREPACPEAGSSRPAGIGSAPPVLRAEARSIDAIPAATWDALLARTTWATPFSAWAFHRAWWDAYGANAHEETLVVVPADAPADGTAAPVAIVPLMHRHEVEPSDAALHTTMRHGHDPDLTPVPPEATAIFFGASYHADYATILADRADLPAVADAIAAYLATDRLGAAWDVVDLRRLRCGDPAAEALAAAIGAREMAEGWTLNLEREDVCPVVTLPADADLDGYLATLGKKERHEIRRKVRRAEAAGEIRLDDSADPIADLEAFIDLHQKRWGAAGLFPPTLGGDQSRTFIRRLFELLRVGRAAAARVPDRRWPAHRRRRPFRDARWVPLLQRRGGSGRPRALAGGRDGPCVRRAGARGGQAPPRLPAGRRTVQVRVGRRRRAHPAPAGPAKGRVR